MRENRIESDMRSFSALTGVAMSRVGQDGACQYRSGAECACCRALTRLLPGERLCERLHARAGEFARDLGETYLFSCHSGLYHAAVPLPGGGTALAGPFWLGEADPSLIPDEFAGAAVDPEELRKMRESSANIRALNTEEAYALLTLLYDLFAGEAKDAPDDARTRSLQQRRIAEAVQSRKALEASGSPYPIEMERELIRYVREGDSDRADAVLNELLGYAFFSSANIEDIRACAAELCALLSRAAIEGGAESEGALQRNREFMRALWRAETVEDLCYCTQEAVERFCESAFARRRTGERECVQRAIRVIHMRYAEPLTLSDVAAEVHLSESYFSTLFKRGCGVGFREYLTAVRVDRAKELLEKSAQTVTEIAASTGFESQSYFSKVFRAATGLSPLAYRRGGSD